MKITRLIGGILIAVIVLNFTVESLEFFIVSSASAVSIEDTSLSQTQYFEVRNQAWILILKTVYTFLFAVLAGWLGTKVTKHLTKQFLIIAVVFQLAAFFYAMFFSEFKDTLPVWYWFLLLVLVLGGLFTGNRLTMINDLNNRKRNV